MKAIQTCLLSTAVLASSTALAQYDLSIGFNAQNFDYNEVVMSQPFMESHGQTAGLSVHVTKDFKKRLQVSFDAIQEFGSTDYTAGHQGIGAKYGEIQAFDEPHREHNLTLSAGLKIKQSKHMTFIPSLGLNYRHFFQDTGQSFTKYDNIWIGSYNRETRYLTAPVGATMTIDLPAKMQLSFTGTYDFLVYGRQDSYISNLDLEGSDLKNIQHSGHGYYLAAQFNFSAYAQNLYAKLFHQSYHIADSRFKIVTNEWGDTTGGTEPENTTDKTGFEFGIYI